MKKMLLTISIIMMSCALFVNCSIAEFTDVVSLSGNISTYENIEYAVVDHEATTILYYETTDFSALGVSDSDYFDSVDTRLISVSGTAAITGYHAEAGITDLVIPDYYEVNGKYYLVEEIGPCAFMSCETLQSLTLSDSIRVLRDSCFTECENLTYAELPSDVSTIEDGAFTNCFSLQNLIVHSWDVSYLFIDNVNYNSEYTNVVVQ